MLAQQTKDIPNLVKAKAEEIGALFAHSSVDEIVANNIVHGTFNWGQAMTAAAKILKPGGCVSIAPYPAGDLAAHIGRQVCSRNWCALQAVGESAYRRLCDAEAADA